MSRGVACQTQGVSPAQFASANSLCAQFASANSL